MLYTLPDQGLDVAASRDRLTKLRQGDWDAHSGRLPLHCYFASNAVDEISQSAGSITSGGTESIILALKAARHYAASKRITAHPNIVIPDSAHPAFDKAAQLIGLTVTRVAVSADLRCNVSAMEAAVTPDTILIAGSAPSLPFGLINHLAELNEVALRKNVWMHVDACIGGLLAPFVRELGYALPAFDFALPAVRSISADLHKFGYSAKGASLVLYRSEDDHRFQFSHFSNWPKGEYFTPTLAGTRSGGPIASAWAVMHYPGRQGYLEITSALMSLRDHYLAEFKRIPALSGIGPPDLTVVTVTSPSLNIFTIANKMRDRGWYMSLVARSRAIQQTVNLVRENRFNEYFDDLRQSIAGISHAPENAEHALEERLVLTY